MAGMPNACLSADHLQPHAARCPGSHALRSQLHALPGHQRLSVLHYSNSPARLGGSRCGAVGPGPPLHPPVLLVRGSVHHRQHPQPLAAARACSAAAALYEGSQAILRQHQLAAEGAAVGGLRVAAGRLDPRYQGTRAPGYQGITTRSPQLASRLLACTRGWCAESAEAHHVHAHGA